MAEHKEKCTEAENITAVLSRPAQAADKWKALAKLQKKENPGRCLGNGRDFCLQTPMGADYFSAAAGASVAISTFTPGPMVEEIETRLM